MECLASIVAECVLPLLEVALGYLHQLTLVEVVEGVDIRLGDARLQSGIHLKHTCHLLGVTCQNQHPVAIILVGECGEEGIDNKFSGVARVVGLIELVSFVDKEYSALSFLYGGEGFLALGVVVLPEQIGSFAHHHMASREHSGAAEHTAHQFCHGGLAGAGRTQKHGVQRCGEHRQSMLAAHTVEVHKMLIAYEFLFHCPESGEMVELCRERLFGLFGFVIDVFVGFFRFYVLLRCRVEFL